MPAGTFAGAPKPAGDGIPTAFREGLSRISREVVEAAGREELWLERIRAGLEALLGFLDAEPAWATVVLEAPLDGPAVVECSELVHRALREVLYAGRGTVIVGTDLTPPTTLIAELLVAAVLSVTRARTLTADGSPLLALAPSLMQFVVEPYLGRGAANADCAKRPSGSGRVAQEAKVVPVRMHPRIMQALGVMATRPGLSSREIELAVSAKDARGSDISDVLKRLQQRGLIETARRARNQPNAWLLTPYGRRVLAVMTGNVDGAVLHVRQEGLPQRGPWRGVARSSSHLALVGGRAT